MLEQRIQNRQPDALRGVGVVLAAALAVMAGSAICTWLQVWIGTASSVLFIAYGCAVAWFMLNWFAMVYIYTSTADCLRLCRAYGKRERFIADIRFSQVMAYGAPEDVRKRFPGARTVRATRRQCPFEPFALAWKADGRVNVAVLQPDDNMREHLISAIRSGKKQS